jgi:molecular chaperone DnaK
MRTTVDFGIDLGTTNSAIALARGPTVEVFRNNEGDESTPSAVYINRKGRLVVGRAAKEQLETDAENAFSEFKLQMGTERTYTFTRSGRQMRPEELSGEVLKSLRSDVKQRLGEDVEAAVITVPAAFELPQCEATRKAAELAGLKFSPLLQEPVAAALAYGFQTDSDRVFWLVYDFGGGTFDAAVVQVRDGAIQVPNHAGDNHLGGKLIDWAIVDELLVPALTAEHPLTDFQRGNPRWAAAIAKLKLAAEKAKVRCSRDDAVTLRIERLCKDDRGEAVDFEYELRQADVERLAEPLILRSINICKRVLSEARLAVGDLEKLILVGGPTLMPYLRRRLQDRDEGLGIPLEFSNDPMTVVARGAAIFAGGQRIEGAAPAPTAPGQFALQLEYKPVGADTEPLVGGKVLATDGVDLSRYTIELISGEGDPAWRSGKFGLSAEGSFLTRVNAERGKQNVFLIELRDEKGTQLETMPDRCTYTVGVDMPDQLLVQSIGIALANNTVDVYFTKGSPLPARKRNVRRTAVEARRGQEGAAILIPVVEGENKRADRNRVIGSLEIQGAQVKRHVPPGTDVEVVIDIDQSRVIRAKAFVPFLGEEFENVIHLGKQPPDLTRLEREFHAEKTRLEAARERVRQTGDQRALEIVRRVDGERMVHDVAQALRAAKADPDAADKTQKRLLDLQLAVDALEEALEWPALLVMAQQELDHMRHIMKEFGKPTDQPRATALEQEVHQVMTTADPELLRRTLGEVSTFRLGVWRANNALSYFVAFLHWLDQRRPTMRDPVEAARCVEQGQQAISKGHLPTLEAACRQLSSMLPEDLKRQGAFANDPLLH